MPNDSAKDFLVPSRIERRLEIAGFANAHPAVKLMLFGEVTNAGPHLRRQRADVATENGRPTPGGRQQSQQHSDGGGFAGAVAAQKRKDTPARHLKIQVLDGGLFAEIARQTACVNNRLLIQLSACLLSHASSDQVSSRK